MIPPKYYPFENQLLTVRQIHEMLPAYSHSWLRDAVMDGCKTRADLEARDHAKHRSKPVPRWQNKSNKQHTKYIVEGENFADARSVWNIAKLKGFTGSEASIYRRLAEGKNTWEQLIKPVNEKKSIKARNYRKTSQAAAHAACIAIDQRKKEMP